MCVSLLVRCDDAFCGFGFLLRPENENYISILPGYISFSWNLLFLLRFAAVSFYSLVLLGLIGGGIGVLDGVSVGLGAKRRVLAV